MAKSRLAIPISVFGLAALAFLGFWFWPVTVSVSQPQRGLAIQAIYATGIVEPSVSLAIAPNLAGHLVEVNVEEGQTVVKGQILARLKDQDLRSNVAQLQAQLGYARSYYQRLQALNQRSLVAKLDFDRAKADLQAAEAAVKRADAQRDYMTLQAPAEGLIIRRDAEIGQFVNVGQAIFQLSCCAPLRISAQVDEEDIAKVSLGQRVVLHTEDLPGEVLQARVSEITPKGDPITRSYRVRMQLDQPGNLKIGMSVDTNLLVEQHENALLIPSIAIDKDSAVWLVENGKLHHQAVKIGIQSGARTEILAGLDDQSQLVSTLKSGFSEGQWTLVSD
jgi:RND family efflux transporter MFP subunit